MMLVVSCCWLLLYQPSSVRPDGITLPVTSLIYKSAPADQKPLSISFTPDLCNGTPMPYSSSPSRSIESVNIPTKFLQEPCIVQESQPSFKTVSISTPLNPAIDKPLQIQSFTPNAAFIPQTLSVPQIDSSYLENSKVVNSYVGLNDCTHQLAPPVVQYNPSYVITRTDNCNNKMAVPLVHVMLDNLPSNIHKVKIADSKPIFIDCTKPTKSYQIPSTLTSLNPLAIQNIENPKTPPKLEIVQNSIAENRFNQAREDYVISKGSVLVEIPVTSYNPNTNVREQQFKNTGTTEENKTNIEAPAMTDKIVYPITNVVFNYGQNNFNQYQTACTQKTQTYSVIPPQVTPTDHKVCLELTPIVNANPPQTQNNNKSPDNVICYCNNINLPPKPEPKCYFLGTPTSSSCLFNQAYVPEKDLPIVPISQIPIVNTINKPPTRPPTVPCSILTSANGPQTTSDTFTSQLSCSLNNIISLLTAGLLSTVFGNSPPATPEFTPNMVPTESACDDINFQEPVIDIATTNVNSETVISNPPFVSCPLLIDSPVVLPSPEINLPLKEADSDEYLSVLSALSAQRAPKCKSYLASITINIMPSSDTTNDIIIVI